MHEAVLTSVEELKRALTEAAAALAADAAAALARAERQEAAAILWREELLQLASRLRGLLRRRAEVDQRHRALRTVLQRRQAHLPVATTGTVATSGIADTQCGCVTLEVEVDYDSMVSKPRQMDIYCEPPVPTTVRRRESTAQDINKGCIDCVDHVMDTMQEGHVHSASAYNSAGAWLHEQWAAPSPWSSTAVCSGWEAMPETAWPDIDAAAVENHLLQTIASESWGTTCTVYGDNVRVEDVEDYHWSSSSNGIDHQAACLRAASEAEEMAPALVLPPVLPALEGAGDDGAAECYAWFGVPQTAWLGVACEAEEMAPALVLPPVLPALPGAVAFGTAECYAYGASDEEFSEGTLTL